MLQKIFRKFFVVLLTPIALAAWLFFLAVVVFVIGGMDFFVWVFNGEDYDGVPLMWRELLRPAIRQIGVEWWHLFDFRDRLGNYFYDKEVAR
jgi:hypothetical protein